MILKGYLFGALYGLVCLALALLLYKLGVEKKITRKVVHILVGFEWVILHHFMGPSVHFLIVCILFTLLLLLSHRKNLMPMISSDGDNAPGTVYYGVAMTIMATVTLFVPSMIVPFGIGVFCTSFGDGFAGLLGQLTTRHNPKIYGNKTIFGSLYNFLISLLVVVVFNISFSLGFSVWHILALAFFVTELELFTGHGLDNIVITLGAAFLSYAFLNFEATVSYLVPILLTPFIIAFSRLKRALTLGGILAAVAVDIFISVSLGNAGFGLLLAFFALGVAVDKIKKKYKKSRQKEKEPTEKRSDCRDEVQVLANSLVASVCAVLYAVTFKRVFVIAFVASLAEALADTVASGIGVLNPKAFDLFRMKHCKPGISGGMSVLGTASSLLAAMLMAGLACLFGLIDGGEFLLITASAFLGGVFDSFLGSIFQVKYRCTVCGEIVEREEHCASSTEKVSGLTFVSNDLVNLLGTLFAAAVAAALYTFY